MGAAPARRRWYDGAVQQEPWWRSQPPLTNRDAAVAFVERAGLCLFQPAAGVAMPSLYEAIAGRPGPPPPWGEHDEAFGHCWTWKDELLAEGRVLVGAGLWSGRFFAGQSLIPALLAASPAGQYGAEPADCRELHADGRLGQEAFRLCEALLANGAASTTRLRELTGLDHRAFTRAQNEAQRTLLIVPVGVAQDNAWRYCFRYDLTVRRFPAAAAAARALTTRAALGRVIWQEVALAGPGATFDPARLARRYRPWADATTVRRAVDALTAAGQLHRCDGLFLADPDALAAHWRIESPLP